MEVGVRELRDNLSRYLERVRDGEDVVVTEHGRAIARLLPLTGERLIDRLIREGKVTPASSPRRSLPKPVKAKRPVSDLVGEQRR
jgi:prevent-host-death family protein